MGSDGSERGLGARLTSFVEAQPPVRIIGLVVAAALLTAAVAFVVTRGGDDSLGTRGGEDLVAEFAGEGDDTTGSFTVDRDWEIRWESQGDLFELDLVEDGGPVPVVAREGPGGGSSYPNTRGTFELEVRADGAWTVRVLEVPR